MRFGDLDGVGGGGESEAIEHILPSPPGLLYRDGWDGGWSRFRFFKDDVQKRE
jgi:hypothetical protein